MKEALKLIITGTLIWLIAALIFHIFTLI